MISLWCLQEHLQEEHALLAARLKEGLERRLLERFFEGPEDLRVLCEVRAVDGPPHQP